jgi:hypothetical protein
MNSTALRSRFNRFWQTFRSNELNVFRVRKRVVSLRDAYLEAGVVGSESTKDAEHIALATVAGVDIAVSWNFKHIVHYEKIGGYEGVNTLNGYRSPKIYSPREVVTW